MVFKRREGVNRPEALRPHVPVTEFSVYDLDGAFDVKMPFSEDRTRSDLDGLGDFYFSLALGAEIDHENPVANHRDHIFGINSHGKWDFAREGAGVSLLAMIST